MKEVKDILESTIDWFAIDLCAFEDFVTRAKADRAQAVANAQQADRCFEHTCGHGPYTKKGLPDRRTRCERLDEALKMQDQAHLAFTVSGLLWEFFVEIGLMETL